MKAKEVTFHNRRSQIPNIMWLKDFDQLLSKKEQHSFIDHRIIQADLSKSANSLTHSL